MLRVAVLFSCCLFAAVVLAQGAESIVGSWQFKNNEMEIVSELFGDGTLHQVTVSSKGQETHVGRYQLSGQVLTLYPQGGYQPMQLMCRFLDADTLLVTYPSGESLQWERLKSARPGTREEKTAPSHASKPGSTGRTAADLSSSTHTARRRPTLLMQLTWEPKERAFTLLVPKGWRIQGGVFNVKPLEMNGPGNTMGPKCDFTVKSDDRGTVMVRWVPGWNYADLTYSPTGFSLFKPGQHYQGMPVKLLPIAKQFLTELFKGSHPPRLRT